MKRLTPDQIRDASLPKSLRGFDETATRELLSEVATVVQKLTAERDALRKELDAAAPSGDSVDPVAIGNALLTAQRAGEALVAEAREGAARLTAEAQEEAERVVEQARREAAEVEQQFGERRGELEREHERLSDELGKLQATAEAERRVMLARVRAEAEEHTARAEERLTALKHEEESLRELIDDRRRKFVEMLESTLGEIERLDAGPDALADLLTSRAGDARDLSQAAVSDGEAEHGAEPEQPQA